jgi:hypothetical protein
MTKTHIPRESTITQDGVVVHGPGLKCRSGCKTKDHYSWGECLQAAEVGVYHVAVSKGFDGTTQKKWDRELDAYKAARKEGIKPDGTKHKKIDEARRLSDAAGAAYGRDFSKSTPMEA